MFKKECFTYIPLKIDDLRPVSDAKDEYGLLSSYCVATTTSLTTYVLFIVFMEILHFFIVLETNNEMLA